MHKDIKQDCEAVVTMMYTLKERTGEFFHEDKEVWENETQTNEVVNVSCQSKKEILFLLYPPHSLSSDNYSNDSNNDDEANTTAFKRSFLMHLTIS
eukprot:14212186-Ditylum_brightwellii.AAC.1